MFDIGMTELLVIGIVALIVVGPKDLPGMFRTLGRFTGKLRAMAREFQRAMDDAADQSGVKDVAKDLKEATSSKSMGLDTLKDAADRFEAWDPAQRNRKGAKAATTAVAKASGPAGAAVAGATAAGTASAGSDTASGAPADTTPKPDEPQIVHGPNTAALADAQAARRAERLATAAERKSASEARKQAET